ncbi:response regulator [Engelhardtia mirabilis]|uniref:Arginine utilization regulatory protein RocR n=1 Tax=Engelhardtia mirabilis TaxID=2528011 RepID=A0A518BRW0_9BACT|nr:Arginine utilization regulatory protein RocR [Planctomycetes bacterium Pla133]QDV04035.1 Arginine utilization regulatory protein RocR [Planctomycetes bacterium Pla86]
MGRILVIEDEPGTQILLQSRLQDLGHEVVTAPTGAMGLMEARAGGFDLFVVDVQLGPGVDGYEVCRRLKSMPGVQGVPVVLLSGRVRDRSELHLGYEAGCDSYLVKGEDPLIEDVVRAMLRLKALRDELARQNQLLELQNQRLERGHKVHHDPQNGAEVVVEPDALLVVDADGVVTAADRGSHTLFAGEVSGRHVGALAPGTGLEAWVRDSRDELRPGHLFALAQRGSIPARRVSATVIPLPGSAVGEARDARIVLLKQVDGPAVVGGIEAGEGAAWELAERRDELRQAFQPGTLVGRSAAIAEVRSALLRHATQNGPLVLAAPTSQQIRRLARILHFTGERRGPIVPVPCAVLEAEGGGDAELRELVQRAGDGTLLFEDIDRLSTVRRRSLRALSQESAARMLVGVVGGQARATALADELGAETLVLPPLSERRDDVLDLARFALARFSAKSAPRDLSEEASWVLENHDWPGDVRELDAAVEEACRMARGSLIEVSDLPAELRDLHEELARRGTLMPARPMERPTPGTHVGVDPSASIAFDIPVDEPLRLEMGEPLIIEEALRRSQGNVKEAAGLLGIGRSTLYRKLKEHGLR